MYEITVERTRFGSPWTRLWTSCCMRQASTPQLRHARKCLDSVSDLRSKGEKWSKLTIDEGVQDGHGTVGDTSIWVDLLENCGVLVMDVTIKWRDG